MTNPPDPPLPFDSTESQAAWDSAADAWDDFVESGLDYYRTEFHGPALLDACGPLEGRRVLDLGCGQGYFSRLLAARGACVIGIDLSTAQIAHAIRHEEAAPTGTEFLAIDAAEVASRWPPGSFDLAVSCVAMQDMAEAEVVAEGVQRTLIDEGRFVFSIPHPLSTTIFRQWERDEAGNKGALRIDRYFESGPRILSWEMRRLRRHWRTPYWSRTIEEWSEILDRAGFLIRRLREPRPSIEAVARVPQLEDGLRLPSFLIFDAVRSGIENPSRS